MLHFGVKGTDDDDDNDDLCLSSVRSLEVL
jgi:hypothetical protein